MPDGSCRLPGSFVDERMCIAGVRRRMTASVEIVNASSLAARHARSAVGMMLYAGNANSRVIPIANPNATTDLEFQFTPFS